jgi:hypothetical protein
VRPHTDGRHPGIRLHEPPIGPLSNCCAATQAVIVDRRFPSTNEDPIPIGIGAGKVWKAGTTIMNLFVEPQWTVAHDGDGYPKVTVFAGLNMTFGK